MNNYFSRISYSKPINSTAGGYLKITSEKGDGIAEGTLTVTLPEKRKAYKTNYWNFSRCALIGGGNPGSGDNNKRQVSGLEFNGGIVYVGLEEIAGSNWTTNENLMTCIGAVNSSANITINGGILTSVAYGPGSAIGGGAGWDDVGGVGNVTINGGNVYAYSRGGVAIGGGTSSRLKGGDADITIKGGNVYANSLSGKIGSNDVESGTAIGGGSAGIKDTLHLKDGTVEYQNGGSATIKVTGGMIQTGSLGGGNHDNELGKIGWAKVTISGGETSGQFLLVKGTTGDNDFNMTGGTIKNSSTSDNTCKKVQNNGGAVYMESGSCTIKGGTISKCSGTLGGAVYMNGGTFTMSGGKISDCKGEKDGGAVYIEGGDATVSGGEIHHNIASKGNGGGVYVSGGNFTMPSNGKGQILNNAADTDPVMKDGTYYGGNGGGIYVRSTTKDVNVDIISGTMQNNAADRNGGGLCVDMEGSSKKASITIGNDTVSKRNINSPNISQNSAALSGGGMSVQGNGSNITIYSGTVKGNVSAFVKNEDIRNDGGLVELVGKNDPGKDPQVDVRYNTIKFYANNGNDPEPYDEQRVITSTNSILQPTATALAFEKEFFHIASWNTKRDGTGTSYTVDGRDSKTGKSAIMNITADVSLYAQWVANQ